MTKKPKQTSSTQTLAGRIKYVREINSLTQEEFAAPIGVKRGSVGNWELGKGISREKLISIADHFGAKLDWLERNVGKPPLPLNSVGIHIESGSVLGDEPTHRDTDDVKLVGRVGAGGREYRHNIPEQYLDTVLRPPGASATTVAVDIKGTSLGPFDGWIAYYDTRRAPVTDDLVGQLCVVGLSNDDTFIKTIERGSSKGKFNLISADDDPIEDVEIEWAARVDFLSRWRSR